jgi:hypothetical protein
MILPRLGNTSTTYPVSDWHRRVPKIPSQTLFFLVETVLALRSTLARTQAEFDFGCTMTD